MLVHPSLLHAVSLEEAGVHPHSPTPQLELLADLVVGQPPGGVWDEHPSHSGVLEAQRLTE